MAGPAQIPNIQMAHQVGPQNALVNYSQLAARRKEINDDPLRKLHLQDWEEDRKQNLLKIESYRGRCNATKTELYQLMGFYFVFQGVVFTAAVQRNKLTCQTSFCPALLSLLVSIATAVSVHYKLTYYGTEKFKLIKAHHISANISNRITLLKANGSQFAFNSLMEANDGGFETNKKNEAESQKWFWRVAMLFLIIFSLVIMVSCVIVQCWDEGNNRVRPCAYKLCFGEKGLNTTTTGG